MVRRVIKLMYSEIRGLHQAAYIIAFFAFGSQMLALIRDRMLAHSFGAGVELDLYYAAFRIPDLLFVLFASVLSVYVLLPFVTKAKESEDEKAGARVLAQMFTLFLYFYIAVALIIFAITPYLVSWLYPGLSGEADTLILLIRILLLQPFLLGVSSLLGIVTQLSQRFIIYAVSPLIYNIGIILGILALYPFFGLKGLVAGVVIGALGHMLVQVPLVRSSGLSFGLVRKMDFKLLKSVFKVAIPRAITLSIHQLVLLVFVGLATMMAVGSVSVFQFAFNLQSVPLAIIGMSYSVAAFPVLADLFSKQKREEFNIHLLTAMRHIIFWSVPIVALVIVLRAQIVRVVLGSGAFNWNDTRLTAAILALFIISLAAQSILLLLTRAFYAGGNTKTPLIVAITGATISIGSAFAFLSWFESSPGFKAAIVSLLRLNGIEGMVEGTEVVVLGLAFITGVMIEMFILLTLAMRIFNLECRSLLKQLLQSIAAALIAAVAAYATLKFIVYGINQETFLGILLQGVIAGLAGVVSAMLTYYVLGSKELKEIYRSYHSKIFKTDVIGPQTDTL
jgi:putative peptidoglycan lipid II flippase